MAETETVLSERRVEREAEDALSMAFAAQYRASLMGFDWQDTTGALHKVREETREVDAVIGAGAEDKRRRARKRDGQVRGTLSGGGAPRPSTWPCDAGNGP